MLLSLSIKNYALIQELELEFGPGMTAIVGETGAGKSILVEALGLTLGGRADSHAVSRGEHKCVVEARFETGKELKPFFEANELDFEPVCTLRRELTQTGKSRAFVNDTPVQAGVLKMLAAELIDLHSQHETIELKSHQLQLHTLDSNAGHSKLLARYATAYAEWQAASRLLAELETTENEAARQQEFVSYQYAELNEAALQPGEQPLLEAEQETLANAENILANLHSAVHLLSRNDYSLIDTLTAVNTHLLQAAKHHPALATLVQRLQSATIELKDIAAETEQASDGIALNPQRLEAVNDRLKLLFQLQNKHRVKTVEELIALQLQFEHQLQTITNLSQRLDESRNRLAITQKNLMQAGGELTAGRKKALPAAADAINKLLAEAGMPNARLRIEMETTTNPGPYGYDRVEFLFAANAGSIPIPLHKTASGGELSRLMLCIKTSLAGKNKIGTLIFDEIDSGISGETALKVGTMMQRLGGHHQVITITHLPQIAAKAGHVFAVTKTEKGARTYTGVMPLAGKARLQAIAQMLGGINYSETALQAAAELAAK